jgi:hypothetical protein
VMAEPEPTGDGEPRKNRFTPRAEVQGKPRINALGEGREAATAGKRSDAKTGGRF